MDCLTICLADTSSALPCPAPSCCFQGRMLMAIPNLTIDNLLVLFTMIDRQVL